MNQWQNVKWRDRNAMFCYRMVNAIYGELFQQALHDGLSKSRMKEFEKSAFTRFDDYLNCLNDLPWHIGKQIPTCPSDKSPSHQKSSSPLSLSQSPPD